jgi:hypothetical protein
MRKNKSKKSSKQKSEEQKHTELMEKIRKEINLIGR